MTIWLSQARRSHAIAGDLESIWRGVQKHSSRIVVVIAIAAAVLSAVFATRSASGADASGYLSEAAMLARGDLFHVDVIAALTRDHDPYLTSPLGWRPSPSGGLQSPTYPPGLPLLMAIPQAIAGVDGATAVSIASAGLAVLATALIAMRLAGSTAAVIAALLLAFTPIFIHQSIQPMSDVPVTAAWMICFWLLCRDTPASWSSGIACAIAILIRPNLAPLAIVPLLIAPRRLKFAAPVAIAGVALAVLQRSWYGSPIRSGYGSAEELFALANIGANTSRYLAWLITTAPLLVIAVFGFWRFRAHRTAVALFGFAVFVIAAYLAYAVFDDWSYLRFLLPALAMLAVFAAGELSSWIDRAAAPARAPILFALVLTIIAAGISIARSKDTFNLSAQLARVEVVGDYLRANADPAAALVAGEQSGSMRYYTARSIVRWEAATPEAMTFAIGELGRLNRPIYVVLDAWEEMPFRARFAAVPAVRLDWPPLLEAGTSHRTRVWRLSDRERFQRGENLSTIRLP